MPGDPGTGRLAFVALVTTLAIQIYTSFAATATAVLAPMLAEDLAVPSRLVGVFTGLVYVGGMVASLASGAFIARYGAIRVSQACVLLCAVGVAAMAVLPATAALLLVPAAMILGLGYGPITPASSQVLARTAPPSRMAFTFSVKQTGVPAGTALAGALLPGLALAAGWRWTYAAVVALGVGVALAAQPIRSALDTDRHPGMPFAWRGVHGPLAAVWRHRELRVLALVGMTYSATQTCLVSFLVVYLTTALGWTLVAAGLALTAATLAGVVGRIGWGMVADRTHASIPVLALIGGVAGLASLATALARPEWPGALVIALAAAFGGTAIGWNGVQLAEVARRAPPGQAGAITGGAGFITFAGVVTGPPLFAVLAGLTGSYRAGFGVTAATSLACALVLFRKAKTFPPAPSP